MPIRLLEVSVDAKRREDLEEILEDYAYMATWEDDGKPRRFLAHVVMTAERVEELLEEIEDAFAVGVDEECELRAVLLPVEATLPGADEIEKLDDEDGEGKRRISRDELEAELADDIHPSTTFMALSFLSSVVASAGLLQNDTAVVIGAMVIAPLLRPNVALALALTLGNVRTGIRAFWTGGVGLLAGLVPAVLAGWLLDVDPEISAIASRADLDVADAVVALAAGAAGTLAFLRGVAGPVIGVMVAVALVPPLVTFGLLLGDGLYGPALGALALTAANSLAINLAGIAVFLLHGVKPRSFDDLETAKRASFAALATWAVLLAALVALFLYLG